MQSLFDVADVNKSAAAFNFEKLVWLNQQHMMRAPAARVAPLLRWHLERAGVHVSDEPMLERIVLSQRERAKTVREMAQSSIFFFNAPATYDEKAVRKHISADVLALLAEFAEALKELADWTAPAIHDLINGVAAANGVSLGKLAQPIRLAVCGGAVSPPIDATLAILGKSETLSRLLRALTLWGT